MTINFNFTALNIFLIKMQVALILSEFHTMSLGQIPPSPTPSRSTLTSLQTQSHLLFKNKMKQTN